MRAVVQRVHWARVRSEGELVGEIDTGLMILLGVTHDDSESQARWLAKKILGLRIFDDSEGKMNLGLTDVGGKLLVVSQFTLYGDCKKGRRPSFVNAARPEQADRLYQCFVEAAGKLGCEVATGRFQTSMEVELCNNGPVTLVVETP